MDVTRIPESTIAARPDAGNDRAAALAEARRRNGAAQLEAAQGAKARQAEVTAKTREAVAQAIGANTRLSIMRAPDAPIFLYQAIDIDSGKVVNEWPHKQFVEVLNAIEPVAGDNLAGLVIDSEV